MLDFLRKVREKSNRSGTGVLGKILGLYTEILAIHHQARQKQALGMLSLRNIQVKVSKDMGAHKPSNQLIVRRLGRGRLGYIFYPERTFIRVTSNRGQGY